MKIFAYIILILVNIPASAAEQKEEMVYGHHKPIDVELFKKEDFGTYNRSLMIMRRTFQDDIPFYIAIPKTDTYRGVVLLLHGITSSKNIWWQHSGPYAKLREYQEGLLENGYVVVAPDARFHGQRINQGDFKSPMNILQHQEWSKLRDLIAGSAVDFEMLIDYVEDAFPNTPIGVLGQSLGALQTLVLAANDNRIKFAVPIFPPISPLPEILQSVAPMSLAPNIKIPTLLVISDQDIWYSFEDGKKLYQHLGSDKKALVILPTPHEMGMTKATTVLDWINQQL